MIKKTLVILVIILFTFNSISAIAVTQPQTSPLIQTTTIDLQLKNNTIKVNGKSKKLEVEPMIIDNTIKIPTDILTYLGAYVYIDDFKGIFVIKYNGNTMLLNKNKTSIKLNNKESNLEAPPSDVLITSMVPLKGVLGKLGISYTIKNKSIKIIGKMKLMKPQTENIGGLSVIVNNSYLPLYYSQKENKFSGVYSLSRDDIKDVYDLEQSCLYMIQLSNKNYFLVIDRGNWEILKPNGDILKRGSTGWCKSTASKDYRTGYTALELKNGNILIAGLEGKYQILDTSGTKLYEGKWVHKETKFAYCNILSSINLPDGNALMLGTGGRWQIIKPTGEYVSSGYIYDKDEWKDSTAPEGYDWGRDIDYIMSMPNGTFLITDTSPGGDYKYAVLDKNLKILNTGKLGQINPSLPENLKPKPILLSNELVLLPDYTFMKLDGTRLNTKMDAGFGNEGASFENSKGEDILSLTAYILPESIEYYFNGYKIKYKLFSYRLDGKRSFSEAFTDCREPDF